MSRHKTDGLVSTDYPRRRRGAAATRRRQTDPSPRTIHVAAAPPRRATNRRIHLRGLSASSPRRRRDAPETDGTTLAGPRQTRQGLRRLRQDGRLRRRFGRRRRRAGGRGRRVAVVAERREPARVVLLRRRRRRRHRNIKVWDRHGRVDDAERPLEVGRHDGPELRRVLRLRQQPRRVAVRAGRPRGLRRKRRAAVGGLRRRPAEGRLHRAHHQDVLPLRRRRHVVPRGRRTASEREPNRVAATWTAALCLAIVCPADDPCRGRGVNAIESTEVAAHVFQAGVPTGSLHRSAARRAATTATRAPTRRTAAWGTTDKFTAAYGTRPTSSASCLAGDPGFLFYEF